VTGYRDGQRAGGWWRTPVRGAGGPLGRLAPVSAFSITALLAAAYWFLLLLYLPTGSAVLLLLIAAVTVAGLDRLLRLHPQGRFHGPAATVLYLFVPVLFALGAALALAELVDGFWVLPASLIAALLFALSVNAEYLAVDPNAETYETARFALLVVIYLTALALFWVTFEAALPLALSALVVGATALLLTVDILRELEGDTTALLALAGAVAVVLTECRLALYFLGLDAGYAGPLLMVVFYALTGLVQNQVSGRLDRQTALTYCAVAVAGFALILVARTIAA
jgi:hypothetical protein